MNYPKTRFQSLPIASLCLYNIQRETWFLNILSDELSPKKGFNLYQLRHCSYITYSVKTWVIFAATRLVKLEVLAKSFSMFLYLRHTLHYARISFCRSFAPRFFVIIGGFPCHLNTWHKNQHGRRRILLTNSIIPYLISSIPSINSLITISIKSLLPYTIYVKIRHHEIQ